MDDKFKCGMPTVNQDKHLSLNLAKDSPPAVLVETETSPGSNCSPHYDSRGDTSKLEFDMETILRISKKMDNSMKTLNKSNL